MISTALTLQIFNRTPCTCILEFNQAGGFGRFHKTIAARPPFWHQSLARNCQSLAPICQSLEQKSGVSSAHSQFSSSLFCAALGFAGWPKKSGAKVFFRATMEGAPLPRTHSTPSPRAKTQHNPTRTAYADRALPWSLGSSPTSPALGAKVWRKVWGKSLDFESLERSLSFFYEISRAPLPGVAHDSLYNKAYLGGLISLWRQK
jgi:hypothetical protein